MANTQQHLTSFPMQPLIENIQILTAPNAESSFDVKSGHFGHIYFAPYRNTVEANAVTMSQVFKVIVKCVNNLSQPSIATYLTGLVPTKGIKLTLPGPEPAGTSCTYSVSVFLANNSPVSNVITKCISLGQGPSFLTSILYENQDTSGIDEGVIVVIMNDL